MCLRPVHYHQPITWPKNPEKIAPSVPTLTVKDAVAAAEKILGGTFNDHPPTLEYVAKADNTAVLTHVVQIENDATGAWVEAFIDAHSGELVTVTDFVTKASVRALFVIVSPNVFSANDRLVLVPCFAFAKRDPHPRF